MKRVLFALTASALIALPGFSQAASPPRSTQAPTTTAAATAEPLPAGASAAQAGGEAAEHWLLAVSSVEYPVTPSDIYRLTYRQSSGDILTTEIQVASNLVIDLGLFGIIDASHMTFLKLKDSVETLVAGSYSRSYPTLSIESVGNFRVGIGGAGRSFEYKTVWGLSRLSNIMEGIPESANVSLRNVELARRGEPGKAYDIFLAQRSPQGGDDPLLNPGDTITLHAAEQIVRLAGEVRRPGAYELLRGEGLRLLVENFGGGITELADTSRLRIDRRDKNGSNAEYLHFQDAYEKYPDLQDCSSITVFSRDDVRSVVFFEGVVSAGQDEASDTGRVATSGIVMTNAPWFSYPIVEGQRLSELLGLIRNRIAPQADLSSATLIRSDSLPIAIDLGALMSPGSDATDIILKSNDRIYIPEANSSITVSGAVIAPGAFTFQPTSPASFYITRAGGIDPERNNNGSYWISDSKGRKKDSKSPLQGGDRIYVPANAFGYNVVRYLPVVTGVITLLISIETLITQLQGTIR
jgi:polysaccharide biosynthesis/export protein